MRGGEPVQVDVEVEVRGGAGISGGFAHEEAVRAEVDVAARDEEPVDECLDVREQERLAAADGDDGGVALIGGAKAIEDGASRGPGGAVLADAPAAEQVRLQRTAPA